MAPRTSLGHFGYTQKFSAARVLTAMLLNTAGLGIPEYRHAMLSTSTASVVSTLPLGDVIIPHMLSGQCGMWSGDIRFGKIRARRGT